MDQYEWGIVDFGKEKVKKVFIKEKKIIET